MIIVHEVSKVQVQSQDSSKVHLWSANDRSRAITELGRPSERVQLQAAHLSCRGAFSSVEAWCLCSGDDAINLCDY